MLTIVRLSIYALAIGVLAVALRPSQGSAGGEPVYVNTTADNDSSDSQCSFREAIYTTNYNYNYGGCVDPDGGYEAIRFALGPGTPIINIVGTPLPLIEGPVSIVGGPDRVELRGPNLPDFDGLQITTLAPGTTIRRLVTSGFTANHIEVYADDVTITGNYIGTDSTGTQDMGGFTGIYVESAARTTIGGTNGVSESACTGDCNLMSGHYYGVRLKSTVDSAVLGNFVGTNALGTVAIPNNQGVEVASGMALIGGTVAGSGNLISGNTGVGIFVYASNLSPSLGVSVIQGNRIGVNAAGTQAIPNNDGIYLDGASYTRIGDGGTGSGNIISGNTRYGIEICCARNLVIRSNLIGTLANGMPQGNGSHGIRIREYSGDHFIGAGGSSDPPNVIAYNGGDGIRVDGEYYPVESQGTLIYRNSIFSNVGKGIETINLGNAELPPPTILDASSQGANGTGGCAQCGVALYADSEDEGRVFIAEVEPDTTGAWSYSGALPGPNLTATLIDTLNNTSEFSAPFTLPATPTPSPSPTLSPTPTPTSTPIATATASATPSSGLTQGDNDCDGDSDDVDMLVSLQSTAGLPYDREPGCPQLGGAIPAGGEPRFFGDIDCDGGVDVVDALQILRHISGVGVSQPTGCAEIGQPL